MRPIKPMFSKPPPEQGSSELRSSVRKLFAAIFLGLAIFTTINLWWRHSDQVAEARRDAKNLTLILSDHLQRSIDAINVALAQLAKYGDREGVSAPIDVWGPQLEIAMQALSSVGSLSVLDHQGRIVHSTIPDIVGQSRAGHFLFQELARDPEKRLVADAPFLSPRSGKTLMPMGRRINGAHGEFAGAIVATLEPERLRSFYQSIHVGTSGAIWLFHPAGFIMFREPADTDGLTGRIVSGHPLLTAAAPEKNGTLHAPLDNSGKSYLSSYRTLGNPPLVVAVSVSDAQILRIWFQENFAHIGLLIFSGLALLIAWLLIDREIGNRLDAAASLQKSQKQFREIFDYAPIIVTVKDRNGQYLFVNRGFEQWSGRKSAELLGSTVRNVFGDTKPADEHEALEREVIETGKPVKREIATLDDGVYQSSLVLKFPLLDSRREVEAIATFAVDITEKKRASDSFERVFASSADLILLVESKGGLVRVSPSSKAILGRTPEEMAGHNAAEFIHPDDLEIARAELRMARRVHATSHFETRYMHKDGRPVALAWTGVWSQPEQLHFFIGRDMTERNKLERELRQTQKMEAIGQLTGGIAHDYNNLLTVILGNSELLTEALREQPELQSLAQVALDAAERSATLTQRLLAFGRGQALESKTTDVNELLAGMVELMRPTLGEQVDIVFRPGKAVWNLVVDRGQLETSVLNLAVNARDAMPTGGRLTIETANATVDEEDVSLSPDMVKGEYVVVTVSDTGAGMTSEVLSRVFEPFFTTKEVGKGTGLGLSMIYGFVKQSGGHLTIYSEPGSGTMVRLYFPRSEAAAAAAPSTANGRDKVVLPTGTETILLVEDDPLVRAHAKKQLLSLGYTVEEADKASDALAQIEGGLKPDLLMTDIIMPGGMNGRELADRLRAQDPGLRVLFTSGYTQGALDSVGWAHATEFLSKPFRRSELATTVRDLLDEKQHADA